MYWNISLTANEKSLLDDLLFHALFVKISKYKPGVFVHTNHAPVNRLLGEGKRMREDYRERFRILGLRIAYYRKMRGMTQEQFAEAIGRSVSFVSQIEANNAAEVKGVSLETLFLMSEKLGVPMARLFED